MRCSFQRYILTSFLPRLDGRKRALQQQKDELIKETKAKVAAIDNVRQQLDIFLKVCVLSDVSLCAGMKHACRLPPKPKRRSTT